MFSEKLLSNSSSLLGPHRTKQLHENKTTEKIQKQKREKKYLLKLMGGGSRDNTGAEMVKQNKVRQQGGEKKKKRAQLSNFLEVLIGQQIGRVK